MSIALAGSLHAAATPRPLDQLVVFEDLHCVYCTLWEHDVGRIYEKTDEAKVLALRRVDYRAPRPDDLAAVAPITTWPTFVVIHCGREFRRITGYNSQYQFWGLLDNAIRALRTAPTCQGKPS
ncbi:MAG TPA: hypothetical protein VIN40_02805 [Candidatus Tyrphobacter sp.]